MLIYSLLTIIHGTSIWSAHWRTLALFRMGHSKDLSGTCSSLDWYRTEHNGQRLGPRCWRYRLWNSFLLVLCTVEACFGRLRQLHLWLLYRLHEYQSFGNWTLINWCYSQQKGLRRRYREVLYLHPSFQQQL